MLEKETSTNLQEESSGTEEQTVGPSLQLPLAATAHSLRPLIHPEITAQTCGPSPLQEPQKRHALHHSFICCAIQSKHPHSNPCTTISHAPYVRIPIGKLKYQPCKAGEEAGTLQAIQPPNCICPSQRELNDR